MTARLQTHRADVLRPEATTSASGFVSESFVEQETDLRGSHQAMSEERRLTAFGDIPDVDSVWYGNTPQDIRLGDLLAVRHQREDASAARRFKVLGRPRDMGARLRVHAIPLKLYDANAATGGGS